MPEINITKGDIATALERIEDAPWSDNRKIDELVRSSSHLHHLMLAVTEGARLLADVLADAGGWQEEAIANKKGGIVARAGLTQILADFDEFNDRRA